MRYQALIALALALTQLGCKVEEEVGLWKPAQVSAASRQGLERLKREFLRIEDLEIGDGPIAAWGRKVTADIEVRYRDGTLVYRGPAISYWGMKADVFIHNDVDADGVLSFGQKGIELGLNGMAVGGKRRIIVPPNLVCYSGAVGQSTSKGAEPQTSCRLVRRFLKNGGITHVRKQQLIVDATLTASCIPGFRGNPRFLGRWEARCRGTTWPQRSPSDPIWRFYYAKPLPSTA